MPLKPRGESSAAELRPPGGTAGSLGALLGSLGVVLGLFFLVAWFLRRGMPKGSTLLPGDVVEVLGRAPLPGRQQMHLVRCGNKLLLICISAGGAETLTEITDPEEVDRLAGLCRAANPQSATASFRQVLNQFGSERGSAAYSPIQSSTRLASALSLNRAINPTEDGDV